MRLLVSLIVALVLPGLASAQSVVITPATSLTCTDGQVPLKASGVWTCGAGTGTGTVTSATLTSGTLTKATGAGAIANSICVESGTTLTCTGTVNATAALQLNGTAYPSPTNIALLNAANTFTAFGTHTWSAGGTGGNIFAFRNTSAGAGNYTQIWLGNDASPYGGVIELNASNHASKPSVFGLTAADVGGMSLTASHGSGDVRIYSRNVLAVTVGATQAMRLHGYGAGTLVTDASGNVTASSDERLKDISGEFTPSLSALAGLNPILHKWKSTTGYDSENTYASWSAQNVQRFIPEAVGIDPRGFLTVNDRPILLTVVNAIQDITAELDELRKETGLSAKSRTMAPVTGTSRNINSDTQSRRAETAKAAEEKRNAEAKCNADNAKRIKQGQQPVVCGGVK